MKFGLGTAIYDIFIRANKPISNLKENCGALRESCLRKAGFVTRDELATYQHIIKQMREEIDKLKKDR